MLPDAIPSVQKWDPSKNKTALFTILKEIENNIIPQITHGYFYDV